MAMGNPSHDDGSLQIPTLPDCCIKLEEVQLVSIGQVKCLLVCLNNGESISTSLKSGMVLDEVIEQLTGLVHTLKTFKNS